MRMRPGLAALMLVILCSVPARAVEIKGKVVEVDGKTVKVKPESTDVPNIGDKVEIYFQVPGLDDKATVAVGQVSEVTADFVVVKIEKANTKIVKDQLVAVYSDQPKKRGQAAATDQSKNGAPAISSDKPKTNTLTSEAKPRAQRVTPADPQQAATRLKRLGIATPTLVDKLDVKGVPEDTVVYAVIRPAALLARDAQLTEAVGMMEKELELSKNIGISPTQVEELRVMALDLTVPGEGVQIEPVMIVRTKEPTGWTSLTDQWIDVERAQHNGQTYLRQGPDDVLGGGFSYFPADERTIVVSPREAALRAFIDTVQSGAPPRWADEFKRVEGADAALAVDVKFFARLLERQMQQQPLGADSTMALAVAPLWRQTNTMVAGAKIDRTLKAEAYAICKSDEAAEQVAETITAGRVLLQNMLPLIRREATAAPETPELVRLQTDLLDRLEKLLSKVKPAREGSVVSLKIEGSEAFGPLAASLLVPAVTQARQAAQQTQSSNNLKQIVLAMHMYHDLRKNFPAAVMFGPEGKTPHSWRVAILPYLEQQALYDQYKFDEPWDSEDNKKLLDKMPSVYRHPTASISGRAATMSSYYVLTGKGALFNEEPAATGSKFSAIRDGTSNTILVVEAKRDIPWTKPVDIPFDSDKELPKLGGFVRQGFAAALGDGSVRFLKRSLDEKVLRALITPDGGEIIPPEAFDR